MSLLIFLVIVVGGALLSGLFIVPQQEAYVIERLGKFRSVQFAGPHLKVPWTDRIANKVTLKQRQLKLSLEPKTNDNVFVTVTAAVQYKVDPRQVKTAVYELENPQDQLKSYLEDALRSAIPKLNLDDVFARKDDIANDVQQTLGEEMLKYGFIIQKTLLTDIEPAHDVKQAMDSINAAQREKEAAIQRAEAARIEIVEKAKADAEKARLQGAGQANARREVAKGIVDQFISLRDVGMDLNEINNTVMLSQYLDSMKEIGRSNNAKVVMLPASTPGGFLDMKNQLMETIIAGSDAQGDTRPVMVPDTPVVTTPKHAHAPVTTPFQKNR